MADVRLVGQRLIRALDKRCLLCVSERFTSGGFLAAPIRRFLYHRLGQHCNPVLRKSRAAGGQNEHLESVPAMWWAGSESLTACPAT